MAFVCERCGTKSIAVPYVEKIKDRWYHFCSSSCAKEYKAFNEFSKKGISLQSDKNVAEDSSPSKPTFTTKLRCALCGLRLVGRIYKRRVGEQNLLFCCKGCADHYESEVLSHT